MPSARRIFEIAAVSLLVVVGYHTAMHRKTA